MPKEYPIGTIREWQKGRVIKAHKPMDPFSSGWILLKTSPRLQEIGQQCDALAREILKYKIPINGEKFLDHEIDEYTDADGNKIFTADLFKQYEGFYGAGRYSFRNEFSRQYMEDEMRLKEEISAALVQANKEKGGDSKRIVLTDEERNEIKKRVIAEHKECANPFTVEHAQKLYEIVRRVKAQLEEGVDFKDPKKKEIYQKFISAADSIPMLYDKIKIKRALKNSMIEMIEDAFSDNWGVRESCKDYINNKFQEYVRKYAEQISKDALDEQMERFGVTIDMEPDEFYKRIYDKIDEELDSDDGSFKDLIYLRFLKKYGKVVDGNWSLEHLPALHNLEKTILELPEGHFLKNDMVTLITNRTYKGGDRGGYAWYDGADRRINFSANCVEKGSVFGVLKDPDEFRSVLFHEIGHAVSKKLGRQEFYDYRKFVVECGWTYQSPELRSNMTATAGDKPIPRTGSNSNIKLITLYATTSPEEAFAEYYSFYNLHKNEIDKFLDTGNENFLKKTVVYKIDSEDGIFVGSSNVSKRMLDLSKDSDFKIFDEYNKTMASLSQREEPTKIELVSPWKTTFTPEEVQKYDPQLLRARKDLNISKMPPTVSYRKNDKNVIIDGITRVEAARMNKRAVPTITLSYEFYKNLKDKGWSDEQISNCAYTQYKNERTPYQKKSEVKIYGMTYHHQFVPVDVLKENVDVFRAMRKIYNSKELQKALSELFEKSIGDGVSKNMTINQIAERHGVPIKVIIEQLKMGVRVEMEHTTDKQEAKRIALDHLYEFPDYYTRLKIMEEQAEEDIPPHKIDIKKSGGGVLIIFTDVIEKARSGRYVDNSENRRLGRVGMTYGEYQRKLEFDEERRVEERSKNLDPIYEKVSKRIEDGLKKAGYEVKYISKSSTPYGKSWYLRLDDSVNGDQIRISDHSVGAKRYINDNTVAYIDYRISDEELDKRIDYIVRYLKRKDEKREELNRIREREKQEFEDFSQRRDRLYGELEELGLGVSIVERTYQDIDEIKSKHPDWSNIFQEKLPGGAFKYSYTKPKDSYTSKSKVSREYLRYLEETFLKKSFMVNDVLGIRGSAINLVNSFTEDELITKARSGIYIDNPENRRLKRVGQKYGYKKQDGGVADNNDDNKKSNKGTDEYTDDELANFAKETSDEDLKRAAAGSDERLRIIAKIELERRKSEGLEKEETSDGDKKEESVGNNKEEDKPKDVKQGDKDKKKISEKIKDLIKREREFFRSGGNEPNSEERKNLSEFLKRKSKGIVLVLKKEVKEIEEASIEIGKFFSGKRLSDEEKKAIKTVFGHMALVIGSIAVSGGAGSLLSMGTGVIFKELFLHYLEHVGLMGVARVALFASINSDIEKSGANNDVDEVLEMLINDFANYVKNEKIDEDVWNDVFNKVVEEIINDEDDNSGEDGNK